MSKYSQKVYYDKEVEKSFREFASHIGYNDSKFYEKFIGLLNIQYSFLHKYKSYDRSSKYWGRNSDKLTLQNNKIRESLNREILIRRNPKKKILKDDKIRVSDLASYVFCPVSFAIKTSFEVEKTAEISKSIELRSEKILEQYLKNVKKKRKIDFLFRKLNLPKEELTNWIIEEKIDGKMITISVRADIANWGKLLVVNRLGKSVGSEGRKGYSISVPLDEYYNFIYRGNFGEILGSEIYYRGNDTNPIEAFISQKDNLFGLPDYLLRNKKGTQFLILEKHTWQEESVTSPYPNHVIQAIAYLTCFEQLKLSHAYLLYLQNKHSSRLFRVDNYPKLPNELYTIIDKVKYFLHTKHVDFDSDSINLTKCFRCSVRMYCSHKSGNLSTIELPYGT